MCHAEQYITYCHYRCKYSLYPGSVSEGGTVHTRQCKVSPVIRILFCGTEEQEPAPCETMTKVGIP